jgi:hypothetical protein
LSVGCTAVYKAEATENVQQLSSSDIVVFIGNNCIQCTLSLTRNYYFLGIHLKNYPARKDDLLEILLSGVS